MPPMCTHFKFNIPVLRYVPQVTQPSDYISLDHTFLKYDLENSVKVKVTLKVKVTQSCPTLCDPMDYTVHGILQARILEWVAFPFSRGSSQTRDQTQVSCIAGGFFTNSVMRETSDSPSNASSCSIRSNFKK